MEKIQKGWECRITIIYQSGNVHESWEWYPSKNEANEAGQKFLKRIDAEYEDAREYEVCRHLI